MADGPWTKYQKAAPAGPWEKYAQPKSGAAARIAAAKAGTLALSPEREAQQAEFDLIAEQSMRDPGLAGSLLAGATQGATFGFGDEILGGVAANAGLVGDALTGNWSGMFDRAGDRYAGMRDEARDMLGDARFARPWTTGGAEVAGGVVPALAGVGAVGQAGSLGGKIGMGALAGGAEGAAYGFGSGEGGAYDRVEGALKGGIGGALIGGAIPAVAHLGRKGLEAISNNRSVAKALAAAPSVDDLLAQAGSKYDEARALGAAATPDDTTKLAESMMSMLGGEGLYSPSGRISSAYPKVADALNMVMDYADDVMDPTQMQQVRKLLQGVAKSGDGQEARLGAKMLKSFDDFIEPLAPQFKEANALYSRAMKGDMIDTAIELAGSRAGQFSGSGFENALRTEFRGLERDIIKGKLKGLTPEQVAAISRVAQGGPIENVLRDLGKMAPRGVVSTGMTAGVPFMIGNAIGGPGVGAAMSGAALGFGELGRRGATAMQRKNAEVVSALMRMGGSVADLPQASLPSVAEALALGGFTALPQFADQVGSALMGR